MSGTQAGSQTAVETAKPHGLDMKLEVIVIPVLDIDRAKRFYGGLGWRLDADFAKAEAFRIVQFTPPGSSCSVQFGKGRTSAAPGSAQGLFLVVSDIEAARAGLLACGVEASDVFHQEGQERVKGADPGHRSYSSFVSFRDPDGNSWLVQEVTARLPGLLTFFCLTLAVNLPCRLRPAGQQKSEDQALHDHARERERAKRLALPVQEHNV